MRTCRSSSVPSGRSCEGRRFRIAKDKKCRSSCFWNGISFNLLIHGSQPYFSNIPQYSGQSWTGCCITSPWSMPSLCWVGRLSIIFPLAVATADWKINDIKNTAPLWRRRSQSGAVFNEGEMKRISGHRFSSNCSTVTVAFPSAAKVMPSAD